MPLPSPIFRGAEKTFRQGWILMQLSAQLVRVQPQTLEILVSLPMERIRRQPFLKARPTCRRSALVIVESAVLPDQPTGGLLIG